MDNAEVWADHLARNPDVAAPALQQSATSDQRVWIVLNHDPLVA